MILIFSRAGAQIRQTKAQSCHPAEPHSLPTPAGPEACGGRSKGAVLLPGPGPVPGFIKERDAGPHTALRVARPGLGRGRT